MITFMLYILQVFYILQIMFISGLSSYSTSYSQINSALHYGSNNLVSYSQINSVLHYSSNNNYISNIHKSSIQLSLSAYSYLYSQSMPYIKPSILPSKMPTFAPNLNSYITHMKFKTDLNILKNTLDDFSELDRTILIKTMAYGFNIDEKFIGWNRTSLPVINKLRLQGQTITITLNIDIALISAFLQFLQNPSVLYNLLISRLNTVLSNGQLNTYLNTAVTALGATGLSGTSLTGAAYSPMMLTNILVTDFPSSLPSSQPSSMPSIQPLSMPTNQPSIIPSIQPSIIPSIQPSIIPSIQPSIIPSIQPSIIPSIQPSIIPSIQPSNLPTSQPFSKPSGQPSIFPFSYPSMQPSQPSTQPYLLPSSQPYSIPSLNPTINTHKPITSYPTSVNDQYSAADATSKNLTIAFLVCVPALLLIYIGSFAYYRYCKLKIADKNTAQNNIVSNKVANLEENKETTNIDKIEDNQKDDEDKEEIEIRGVESVSSADTK